MTETTQVVRLCGTAKPWEVAKNGNALSFPALCGHCGALYWYLPHEAVEFPPECDAWLRASNDHGDDKATAWWNGIISKVRST